MGDTVHRKGITLKEMCFRAVREHFSPQDSHSVLDLPRHLIQDLLPHLTVCQLYELQPALNQRGISTHPGWVVVLQDLRGHSFAMDVHTEEEARQEVMKLLFTLVFYGFRNHYVIKNSTNLKSQFFLRAAASCIRQFSLITGLQEPLQSLAAEQRPLLNLLEKRIQSVRISHGIDLLKRGTYAAVYVLHRLLDHGVATKLVVDVPCPIVLSWLLHGRGPQDVDLSLKKQMLSTKSSCDLSAIADGAICSPGLQTEASDDQENHVVPCKRSKVDSVSMEEQFLCGTFPQCDSPLGVCPWGQISGLEIEPCGSDSLRVLNSALPTFFCLRCLSLQSPSSFWESDVLDLAAALKQLSDSHRSSLTDLSIGVLPNAKLMEVLLDASPNVTSLQVEVQTLIWGPGFSPHHPQSATADMSELHLEKLKVKITALQTDLQFMTSVLRRCPHLTSLHIAGMRLPSGQSQKQLLTTLSESNHCLRILSLEDMKLSDCLSDIQNLLKDCKLEELRLKDCRLLENCSDKEERLQQLAAAVRSAASLHTLSLAQNRLAKDVCVLAELFSGSPESSVRRLDLSSNFIQPAELLEFATRLETRRPRHRLTLDLRRNPGDRDPDMWNAALTRLRPFCVLLVRGWKSTGTMVDHVSNM
ncbi:leucine-rich repeat-containing protein 41 [Brachyistius frenatus]|uniref:leucine-rich repeat-containing protein 41 n=1 Tax=Brachyistius frenatus TaxID=100188 RepID=UPI0037E78884